MHILQRHVGVALSGGGHRATLWGLGVLLYLVDTGKNREVGVISSVSGGSITNGVVAHEVDYAEVDTATFDRRIRPLVRHVADVGLFFWGPATNVYVISVLLLAGLGLLTLAAGLVLVALDGLSLRGGLVLLVAAVLLALGIRWFGRRSDVVDRALARTHYSRDGAPTKLAAVGRSLDHVLCATELQAGDHLYLSPGFVYSYQLGMGSPADLDLSTAVQASACLPGAFAARRLPAGRHQFQAGAAEKPPGEMVLTDGGVYDNMADQWLVGLAERLARQPNLPVTARGVDEAVVVNASAGGAWRPFPGSRLPLVAELSTLKRVNDVMYDVTTSHRRQNLVNRWDQADRSGSGMRGAFVHIAQSPYLVADRYRQLADAWPKRAERAAAVLVALGDDDASRRRWQERARASRRVKTVLRKLGSQDSVDLLEHAYVLAMCNLHVLLDYPLLALPARERFSRLLDAS